MSQDLSWVPNGNTVPGINTQVLKYLLKSNPNLKSCFDIPCGDGSFLTAVKRLFPEADVKGLDLFAQPLPEVANCIVKGSVKDWAKLNLGNFEVITCISGVMAFDDVTGLFENAYQRLESQGHFVVSNDNVLTLRDRLHFLFFGSVKRFALCFDIHEGNWNLVLPQALWSQGRKNGFELDKVVYYSDRTEDWLLAPLAILFYPLQFIYMCLQRSDQTFAERMKIFPPQMLWLRHYIMYFKKL